MGLAPKKTRPGAHLSQIAIPAYPHNTALCVVAYYKHYVDRTRSLRGQFTKLFIISMKPFSPVSRDTVANWIKFVLGKAGIDLTIFTPQSTRAASAGMALKVFL